MPEAIAYKNNTQAFFRKYQNKNLETKVTEALTPFVYRMPATIIHTNNVAAFISKNSSKEDKGTQHNIRFFPHLKK